MDRSVRLLLVCLWGSTNAGVWLSYAPAHPFDVVISLLTSGALLVTGLRIATVPYGRRSAGLSCAVGGALYPLGWLLVIAPATGVGSYVGWVVGSAVWIPLVHTVAAFPADATTDRASLPLLVVAAVVLGPLNVALGLYSHPSDFGLPPTAFWPMIAHDPVVSEALAAAYRLGCVGLAVAVCASLVIRLLAAAQFDRLVRTPVLLGSCSAGLIGGLVGALNGLTSDSSTFHDGFTIQSCALLAFPLAVFVAGSRLRRKRERITHFVEQLPDLTVSEIEAALARALLDPSVRIVLWDAQRNRITEDPAGLGAEWGDAGRPAPEDLPGDALPRTSGERAETAFEGRVTVPMQLLSGLLVGWMTTDARLRRYPDLLEAAATAARYTVAYVAQAAVMETTRQELLASRQRTTHQVQAAARAVREKVRNDLHDGAQGEFAALAMRLGLVETRMEPGQRRDDVRSIREDLYGAAHGLRRFIHDLTPPSMQDFLVDVARKAEPLQVQISNTLGELDDEDQRTDLQFALREGVANALKHARATSLRIDMSANGDGDVVVTLTDDGVGGAVPSRGGFTRMSDRLVALDGSLLIDSPPGRGTVLELRFPLAAGSTSRQPRDEEGSNIPCASRSSTTSSGSWTL